jgi:uncharacterized membrane protein
VAIDPNEDGNYGMLYMPKLLTVRMQGLPPEVVRALLDDFNENFDDASGGYYGRRIFSWSTAQALQALSASRLETLPDPEPMRLPAVQESTKLLAAVGFLMALLIVIVILALRQVITITAAILLTLVLYAFLLTLRAIQEGTFERLVLALPNLFQRGSKSQGAKSKKKEP